MSDRQETPRERIFVGTGLFWGFIVVLLLAVAVVILAAQNTRPVRFEWLWYQISTPLVVVILVTALVSVVFAELIGVAWRRRRRTMLSEREELRRLRTERAGREPEEPAERREPEEPDEQAGLFEDRAE